MTRTKDTENFPVGSWLVAKELRPVVHAYYRFARTADDIGDDPAMAADEKIRRLDAMDAELLGGPGDGPAALIRDRLAATAVPIDHCRDLLVAFKRDAITPRTADWADLMQYCRYSAAPVGRFLLDLHGESRDTWEASDALCAALQILNHLQDCRDDYLTMDRVYLPLDYFVQYGAAIDDLRPPKASLALRQVIDHTVASTRPLVRAARALPGGVKSLGLRRESAIIVAIAERLLELLARRDPLAERVELSKLGLALSTLTGLGRTLIPGGLL
jgi:hydroxysqualene synthase